MTADEARITAAIAEIVDETTDKIAAARFVCRVGAESGRDFQTVVRESLIGMLEQIQNIGEGA